MKSHCENIVCVFNEIKEAHDIIVHWEWTGDQTHNVNAINKA